MLGGQNTAADLEANQKIAANEYMRDYYKIYSSFQARGAEKTFKRW